MKLLIFNNTARFSTVLDAFLNEAKGAFDHIYVVFSKKYDAEKDYAKYKNVTFVTPDSKERFMSCLITALNMFQLSSFADYLLAIKKRKLNVRFFKKYAHSLLASNILYSTSGRYIKKYSNEIAVFSTWYDTNAIAAAKVAKAYPNIFTASYAHSYEVDFRKNQFTAVVRDRFKEKYLHEIYFISKNVMVEYISRNKDIFSNIDKYRAVHFGSRKKKEGMASKSEDGVFRIVTCSGISLVKRLDILAEALVQYKGKAKIEWTVLGNGPDYEKISSIVAGNTKNNLEVIFKGSLSNDSVHDYYVDNAVDLFINVSSSEGLPVSIMEAMSYGIPALATDVGGNHEIVTTDTGYPIPAEITAQSLCEQITQIIDDLEICHKKRNAAYDMWSKNYRIERNIGIVIERLQNGK